MKPTMNTERIQQWRRMLHLIYSTKGQYQLCQEFVKPNSQPQHPNLKHEQRNLIDIFPRKRHMMAKRRLEWHLELTPSGKCKLGQGASTIFLYWWLQNTGDKGSSRRNPLGRADENVNGWSHYGKQARDSSKSPKSIIWFFIYKNTYFQTPMQSILIATLVIIAQNMKE